jgi:hypothetical protein
MFHLVKTGQPASARPAFRRNSGSWLAIAVGLIVWAAVQQVSRSHAQLVSVDINGATRSDTAGPGFAKWDLTTAAASAVASFTNYVYTYDPDSGLPIATNIGSVIGCKLTQVNPAGSSTIYLRGDYANKDGNTTSTDPNVGWRLAMDGCRVWWKDDAIPVDMPWTNNGAFSLTISNLSAGVHTITTYHNDIWGKSPPPAWHGANTMSKCIISANGVPVYTNVPTLYATNDSKCGFAYFTISNSFNGQPLILNFDPDHSSVLDFVMLNGFEIDRPSPPGTTASAIFPINGDEHAFANNDLPLPGTANAGSLALKWQPAGFAISNYVYFGTVQSAVLNASNGSSEFKLASAATPGGTNTMNVSNLNSALTYYWRVDQLNISNGETNLVKGAVWKFRTRHLAFPGAEGYGRFARGGRGGIVIEVTNLNDSGLGSYRAAVQASGPRTVVFKVSGLIRLNGPCVIGNGYLTVAGQTAPGDGISLANWRAGLSGANDVIMRFMRMRLSDTVQQAMDGIGLGNSTHSIIDHTSLAWTMDEATSSRQSGRVGSESAMITFQNNLIAEPLQFSYHYDGNDRNYYEPHAFAGSISGEIGSYHHNLIAHSTDRNWSLAGGLDQSQKYAGSLDIRNNVVYNWSGRTTDGGVARLNYVNNYYKSYPTSPSAKYFLKLDALVPAWGTEVVYMAGNVMNGVSGQGDVFTDNWANGGFSNGSTVESQVRTNAEIFPSYVTTLTASNAYKVVLSDSGCNLPLSDALDVRIVGEVLDRTTHYIGTNANPYIINGVVQLRSGVNRPGFIDTQYDVKDFQSTNPALANYSANAPWPPYYTYNVPLDTDHDGLPDWWERIKGFNTNSPATDFSDSNSDLDGDGYTALEDYLNWLAKPNVSCTNSAPLSVDLTRYTRGFTNLNPTYLVFGAVGGTVGLSGRTALFTNTVSTNGLGSFMFKVMDSSGFAYTNTVNVRLMASNPPPPLPPTFFPVPDQIIDANAMLVVTNRASAALVAGERLQFTLLSGPAGARVKGISSTNAVFSWKPTCDQGGTTNLITIQAVNTNNSLSATQSFYVVVPDCVQVSLGRSVVRAGETVSVPVALLSTVTLSNLAVAIDYPVARFTNASWLMVTQEVAGVAFFNAATNGEVDAAMDMRPGHTLRVATNVAFLALTANTKQQSAFVRIEAPVVLAWRPDGTRVTNSFGLAGRIVVVGEEPLMEAVPGTNNQVSLLQYAPTGSVIQIEARTNVFTSPWQFLLQNTQTNLVQDSAKFTTPAPALFFRAFTQ